MATVTGKNGQKYQKKMDQFYHRYGVMFHFPFSHEIEVVSKGYDFFIKNGDWIPTSPEFKKAFNVYTDNKIEASKFLSPVIILEFCKLQEFLTNMTFEVNTKNNLNIQFDDWDLLEEKRKNSLKTPRDFIGEISSHVSAPKFDALMQFFHQLKKFNDFNFNENKTRSRSK